MIKLEEYIDHTLLSPAATNRQIVSLCEEAVKFSFVAVCVNPCWIPLASEVLNGSKVKACAVVGFPLGANFAETKFFEAEKCLEYGAKELDMVMNIGKALSGNWDFVENEIMKIAQLAHANSAILKVILENCLLSKEEIVTACKICVEAGADFVKTSTGFSSGGATIEDVKLMYQTVSGRCKVKAAGGIRNSEQALAMIAAGAQRIGTSAGVAIISGKNSPSGY